MTPRSGLSDAIVLGALNVWGRKARVAPLAQAEPTLSALERKSLVIRGMSPLGGASRARALGGQQIGETAGVGAD